MAEQPGQPSVKIGVKEGGGLPPGYEWNVEIFDQAFDEAMSFLTEDEYAHLASQVRELARRKTRRTATPSTSDPLKTFTRSVIRAEFCES